MIDLSPPRGLVFSDPAQHLLDFGPAFNCDGVDPRLSNPGLKAFVRKSFVTKRYVANDALAVKYQGDVSRGSD
jgi:hypothetical protein